MQDRIESKKPWSFKVYSQFMQNTTHDLRKRGRRLRELSFEARSLFVYLSSFASKNSPVPFPSVHTIQFDTGWGISTIKKYRRELEQAGLLSRDQRKEGGRWSSNLYTLNDPTGPSTIFSSVENQPAENEPAENQSAESEPTKRYQCTGRGTSAENDRRKAPKTSSRSTGPSGGTAAAAEAPPSAPDGGFAPKPPEQTPESKAEEFVQEFRYWSEQAGMSSSVVPRERQAVEDFFSDNEKFTVRELVAVMLSAWMMQETVRKNTNHDVFWHCRVKGKRIATFIKHFPEIQDELNWNGSEKRISRSLRLAQETFSLKAAA